MPENPKSPRDQFVDDVLDAALRNYSRTEPLAGLADRVLRRLEENPPKRAWLAGWRWTAMGAVGTLAVIALALITYPPELRVTPPPVLPGPGAAPSANRGTVRITPAPVVPPPNRSPRFNKTIQQSGVRPGGASGIRPQALSPCAPEQQAALKKKQGEGNDRPQAPANCVPSAPRQHPSPARPPRR